MSIWLDQRNKVIVQGMTGSEGRKHTQRMIGAGTRIVGGVTPGKGGQSVVFEEDPVPVFDSVLEAKEATGANTSVVFVPAAFTRQAVIDAIDAALDLVVVITEGVPVKDTAEFVAYAARVGGHQAARAQLPGPDLARQVERRHHPAGDLRSGPHRPGLEVGHADLPDDVRAA